MRTIIIATGNSGHTYVYRCDSFAEFAKTAKEVYPKLRGDNAQFTKVECFAVQELSINDVDIIVNHGASVAGA